jgi:hypothetical protein
MTAFTIVTTTATQGGDAVEVSTLSDDFTNESEALGYSRRMADEMVGMAHQLSLDFDFSTVGLYEGDLIDEDIDPTHAAFLGAWVLDEDGAAFVGADEFREDPAELDAV